MGSIHDNEETNYKISMSFPAVSRKQQIPMLKT